MKIDETGRIVQFAEKSKGSDLKAMQVDTTLLGLSKQDATKFQYIASMGVYVFRIDVLLKLLKWSYPSCNDFGSEIIPSALNSDNSEKTNHVLQNSSILFYEFLHSPLINALKNGLSSQLLLK
ncbi:hypothetical protein SLEP1_g48093 [Rubroshorea leprosula]|uniref:glucose-1-phosphate adenylyltransferase n=1 Tax=Rubroshorea leprosula TaxID=152421 RepID=A0AAV5LUE5_9ROSI|nr:hypothetical protein SLEP1_g48093 [Rubroshorea leprosula]